MRSKNKNYLTKQIILVCVGLARYNSVNFMNRIVNGFFKYVLKVPKLLRVNENRLRNLESYMCKKTEDFFGRVSKSYGLFKAVKGGNFDTASRLINEGANPDVIGENMGTPVLYACMMGDEHIANRLIERSSAVYSEIPYRNELTNAEDTPLMFASMRGMESTVRLLIARGVSIDYEDADGNTALILACLEERNNIASMLIENGADVNVINYNKEVPLTIACEKNMDSTVDMLIEEGANVDLALACAYEKGNDVVADKLIDRGANIDKALLFACKNRMLRSAVKLINLGADIETENELHERPLTIALKKNMKNLVNKLIDMRAKVRAENSDEVPLVMACEKGMEDTVNRLIENGADVGEAILAACLSEDDNTINKLIEISDNIESEDGQEMPIVVLLYKRKIYNFANKLVKNGANIDEALVYACKNGEEDIAIKLIDMGANVNQYIGEGTYKKSLLMYACQYGYKGIVDKLISVGVDVGEQDDNGRTVLMYACSKGLVHAGEKCDNDSIVARLISVGVDIEARDKSGMTALMYACECKMNRAVDVLLERGAEVDTAFSWMYDKRCRHAADTLLKAIDRYFDKNFVELDSVVKIKGLRNEEIKEGLEAVSKISRLNHLLYEAKGYLNKRGLYNKESVFSEYREKIVQQEVRFLSGQKIIRKRYDNELLLKCDNNRDSHSEVKINVG